MIKDKTSKTSKSGGAFSIIFSSGNQAFYFTKNWLPGKLSGCLGLLDGRLFQALGVACMHFAIITPQNNNMKLITKIMLVFYDNVSMKQ